MKLLLGSDYQTEFSTLDLCARALKEAIAYGKKYKPDAFILAGDLKENYNPVDVRVVQFWVRWIPRLREVFGGVYINLGNHDRISQSKESKNWLDILRAAGAVVVTQPKWKRIGDGHVAFLPYTGDKKQEKQWATELYNSKPNGVTSLIFHTELAGSKYDLYRAASGNDPIDLFMQRYDACFGGHIHYHQQVTENTWFIGSPFCQDWGEVNQTKGHVLAIVGQSTVTLRQLRTAIPHWYDSSYLEEHKIKPEDGAYIRSRISVSSKKISDQVRDEEERLRTLYVHSNDLRFFVIPKVEEQDAGALAFSKASGNREQAELYVRASLPETARFTWKQAVGYLTSKLGSKTCPGSLKTGLRLVKAVGENVLSFPKVEIRYSNQGLVLLKGENRDWPKQSNGAGKTNFLSLLPVALFGKTLKEQTHDKWATEGRRETANVSLFARGGRREMLKISRSRRPHSIQLRIGKNDASTGIRGTGKEETQGLIEKETGLTLNLLLNSVYIDQTIANGFVFGSQKARMDLVAKLCDLERFDGALKAVNGDVAVNEAHTSEEDARYERLQGDVDRLKEDLADLEQEVEKEWGKQERIARKKLTKIQIENARLLGHREFYEGLHAQAAELQGDLDNLNALLDDAKVQSGALNRDLSRAKKLIRAGKCANCGQEAAGIGEQLRHKVIAQAKLHSDAMEKLDKSVRRKETKIEKLRGQVHEYHNRCAAMGYLMAAARRILIQAEKGSTEEKDRNKRVEGKKEALRKQLYYEQRIMKASGDRRKNLSVDMELLQYAKKAFHRSGMPLYLAAGLCPILNSAADEYSEIFFQSKTKVRFVVEDGEFLPQIINPAGSSTVQGQSVGESAMAGVIAAFAVRDAAPKSNVLIMDEPGHGLDMEGAKQFAQGLLKLKGRWETVIITTHHPAIEAVLSGETIWKVIKEKGQSRLVTAPL